MNSTSVPKYHKNLVSWIEDHGGYIHQSLTLFVNTNDRDRGIRTTRSIPPNELLIRLPCHLALCGAFTASKSSDPGLTDDKGVDTGQDAHTPSDWLKCVACLYQHRHANNPLPVTPQPDITHTPGENASSNPCVRNQTQANANHPINDHPYLESLPQSYETLDAWDSELELLCGTHIHELVVSDRKHQITKSRFESHVRPFLQTYLRSCGVDAAVSYEEFQTCVQIISTRGFHTQPPPTGDDTAQAYSGPYLLPFIDLLNHTSDRGKKCTTLKRQSSPSNKAARASTTTAQPSSKKHPNTNDASFVMVAERPIQAGEELLHSYGEDLTSSQFLQTFGFVPTELSRAACSAVLKTDMPNTRNECTPDILTCAVLKRDDIMKHCRQIAHHAPTVTLLRAEIRRTNELRREEVSRPPKKQRRIESTPYQSPENSDDEDVDDEQWDPAEEWEQKILLLKGANITIDPQHPLSDELVTCCTIPFLSAEVLNHYQSSLPDNNSRKGSHLLDQSILLDPFLGQLVTRMLRSLLKEKIASYEPSSDLPDNARSNSKSQLGHVVNGTSRSTHSENLMRKAHQLKSMLDDMDIQNLQDATTNVVQTTVLSGADGSTNRNREIAATTIQLEELYSLLKLENSVQGLM
eukprot:CAMPEP_0194421492 /NCGR_PEP_ID=MMETSP0176-20130528/20724_1 /TAXON_ID=216777 /ORGANISM="Proboscia alata, Strain PI-D3" /LENGTH=635 /DNA_ID=CAMNT_0039229627 /DNA_START=40 /DNA_END=1944 /DNA_ORIENTATION=-